MSQVVGEDEGRKERKGGRMEVGEVEGREKMDQSSAAFPSRHNVPSRSRLQRWPEKQKGDHSNLYRFPI